MHLYCLLDLREFAIAEIFTEIEAAKKAHKKNPHLKLVPVECTNQEFATVWANETVPYQE